MTAWRIYEPIEQVLQLDDCGERDLGTMRVIADTSPSDSYPEHSIQVRIGWLASARLTPEQSAELRGLLERAERDVRIGMTEDPPEVTCG